MWALQVKVDHFVTRTGHPVQLLRTAEITAAMRQEHPCPMAQDTTLRNNRIPRCCKLPHKPINRQALAALEIPNNHGWQCGALKKWGHRAEPFHINLLLLNLCSNIQQWPKALPKDTASHQTAMSCRWAHRLWLTGSSDSTVAVCDISGFQRSNCPPVSEQQHQPAASMGTGIAPLGAQRCLQLSQAQHPVELGRLRSWHCSFLLQGTAWLISGNP